MHSEFNEKEWKNNVHGVLHLLPTQFCHSWDTAVSRESHNPAESHNKHVRTIRVPLTI